MCFTEILIVAILAYACIASYILQERSGAPYKKKYKFYRKSNGKYVCKYYIGRILFIPIYEWYTRHEGGSQYSDGRTYKREFDSVLEAVNSLDYFFDRVTPTVNKKLTRVKPDEVNSSITNSTKEELNHWWNGLTNEKRSNLISEHFYSLDSCMETTYGDIETMFKKEHKIQ